MRIISIALWLCVFALTGCKSTDPQAASSARPSPPPYDTKPSPVTLKSKIDPCKLLTSDELKSIQGEALQTTVPSEREYREFLIAQCYYQLPTITNSVVVNVTTPKEGGKTVKEFWRSSYEDAREGGQRDEKESRPEKISGVGDEAYWEASGIAGALYVLKKNAIFRISVGGASDSRTKLEKSKTLAQHALARI